MKRCCKQMDFELAKTCSHGHERDECVDSLIKYIPKFDEYGIIIHDGGTAMSLIQFCPWCGSKLPSSRRDQWFAALEKQGIDPLADEVPAEFRTDAWFLRRKPD